MFANDWFLFFFFIQTPSRLSRRRSEYAPIILFQMKKPIAVRTVRFAPSCISHSIIQFGITRCKYIQSTNSLIIESRCHALSFAGSYQFITHLKSIKVDTASKFVFHSQIFSRAIISKSVQQYGMFHRTPSNKRSWKRQLASELPEDHYKKQTFRVLIKFQKFISWMFPCNVGIKFLVSWSGFAFFFLVLYFYSIDASRINIESKTGRMQLQLAPSAKII